MGIFIRWKTIAMFVPILPVLAIFLTLFIPDSPTYLISRNMKTEAISAIEQLFGSQFNIKEQA
jgi:hypothetical protein